MLDPRLYQRMIEQARDHALLILDPDGRILSWNLGAERLKGYVADEIIGRHF
jgi:PAS domain S-box-containing protein